ncbi:hypothetical protein D3C71_1978000 [compost metagenome]
MSTGRTGQQQGVAVDVDADVVQRTPLLVEHERLLAVRVVDARGDGFLVVRVGDLVGVLENQRLAIGQAQHHQRAARLVSTDGRDLGVCRHG